MPRLRTTHASVRTTLTRLALAATAAALTVGGLTPSPAGADGTTPSVPAGQARVAKQLFTNPVTPGNHTVTATFDATKYKLAAGASSTFPVSINPGKCLPTEPLVTPAAASSQIGCFSNGSYTLTNDLNDPAAVIWTVNGTQVAPGKYTVSSAGTVVIVATANGPKYGFATGVQTTWTVNFQKPAVCDYQTLALTGESPTGLLIAADLLIVTGLAIFAVRAMRRRPELG